MVLHYTTKTLTLRIVFAIQFNANQMIAFTVRIKLRTSLQCREIICVINNINLDKFQKDVYRSRAYRFRLYILKVVELGQPNACGLVGNNTIS